MKKFNFYEEECRKLKKMWHERFEETLALKNELAEKDKQIGFLLQRNELLEEKEMNAVYDQAQLFIKNQDLQKEIDRLEFMIERLLQFRVKEGRNAGQNQSGGGRNKN